MEHLVVNVEATHALKMWREAETMTQDATRLRAEASTVAKAGRSLADTDPLAAAEKQQKALGLSRRAKALVESAAEARTAARNAVKSAASIPDDTPPEQLEPIRRVPLTRAEIDERAAFAVESAWQRLRVTRNGLLSVSDRTQLADFSGDMAVWAAYRQQLRDLPATTTDPTNVAWPKKPA